MNEPARPRLGGWLRGSASSGWKLPFLGGLLFAAAYYSALPLLDFVAFVPLLARLDARAAERRSSFGAGFLFGFVTFLVGLHFCYELLVYTWLAGLLWVLLAAAFALRIGASVALLGWLRRRTGWGFGVLLPLAWLPFEWLQSFGDLRMTADHVAHSLARHPFLVQFADVTGPYGVGAFVLAACGLIYDCTLGPAGGARRRAAWALAVLAGGVLAYDGWAWLRPYALGPPLRVALVQPDIPQLMKMDETARAEQWSALADLTRQAARERPDLIVWPESARPVALFHWLDRPESFAMADVQALAREVATPLLVGVEYAQVRTPDDWDLYNAALVVDADGRLEPEWAAKHYLGPFAEGLPFRGLLGPWVEGRGGDWHWITGGFDPAPGPGLLSAAGTRIGLLVCYEELFPERRAAVARDREPHPLRARGQHRDLGLRGSPRGVSRRDAAVRARRRDA
jgi:apolipoprotein N-acyltransferase